MSAHAYFSKPPRGCVPLTVRPQKVVRGIQGIPVVVLSGDITAIKERTVSSFHHVRPVTPLPAAPDPTESPRVNA